MVTIRTAAHIPGARHLRGFRSCPTSTGLSTARLDCDRKASAEAARANREARRAWLARGWRVYWERVCGRHVWRAVREVAAVRALAPRRRIGLTI